MSRRRRSSWAAPVLLAAAGLAPGAAAQTARLEVEAPQVVLDSVPFAATIRAVAADGATDVAFTGVVTLVGARLAEGGAEVRFAAADGGARQVDLRIEERGRRTIGLAAADRKGALEVRALPGFLAVAPPLVAIIVAVIFRQVIVALLLGLMCGAFLVHDLDPVRMLFAVSDTYVVDAIRGGDHEKIIVFSLLLGGMVGVMARSGGTHGIVGWLTRFAGTRRSGQVSTAALGTAIFFDDYANCLIVGNTMRPLTDRLRISREKLAYIVDSTAAPVASLVPLSTWVGTQVGLVGDALDGLPGGYDVAPYTMILQAIPYMFYPLFALLLVFVLAGMRRDMFSMWRAERRALVEGKLLRDGAQPLVGGVEDAALEPKEGAPRRAVNALLPILAVIVVTILGLWLTGRGAAREGAGFLENARLVIENSDSYRALLWASLSGVAVAVLLALVQRLLSLDEAMGALVTGMKSMLLAMIILVLAWSLGDVTGRLHADRWLAHALVEVPPDLIPVLTFAVAAVTAFATGTSWGTMGILVPLVVPLAYHLCTNAGFDADHRHIVMLGSIASTLGGAVFGDHCSPISDTTVLSSMAAGCDHIDHVRTQLPYALLAAGFALLAGYLPDAFNVSVFLTLPVGMALLLLFVRVLGRPVETPGGPPQPRMTSSAGC